MSLSAKNSIRPATSSSTPIAPLSLTNLKRAPFASSVVFFIITTGSLALAEANVEVSALTVKSPEVVIAPQPTVPNPVALPLASIE